MGQMAQKERSEKREQSRAPGVLFGDKKKLKQGADAMPIRKSTLEEISRYIDSLHDRLEAYSTSSEATALKAALADAYYAVDHWDLSEV